MEPKCLTYHARQDSFESVDEILKCVHSNESFPVVLLIMLYKVVLTFESVGEIPKCDHSNESY